MSDMNSKVSKSTLVFTFALLASIWLCVHAYLGMRHDGVLYLGQALYHLHPDAYKNDLFFLYGSQDQFSFFSTFYAWIISHLDIGHGAILLYIVSQALFVVGLLLCCRRLYGPYIGIWAAIAIAVTPRNYGGWAVFHYTEQFVTARTLAEPLCLFAIWQLLEQRPARALAILVIAALVHPLIALPCVVLWWVLMVEKDGRWMALIAAVPLALAVGYMGISPFDKLLQTYDLEWLDVIESGTLQMLPLEWRISDWINVAFDVVLVMIGFRFIDESFKSFFKAILVTVLICFSISIVGSSLLQNVLLTSIQIWRAHWILHLFAVSLVPFVVMKAWPMEGWARLAAMFAIAGIYLPPYPGALGAVLMAWVFFHLQDKKTPLSSFMKKVLWAALILAIVAKAGPKIVLAVYRDNVFADSNVDLKETLLSLLFAFPIYFIWALGLAWMAGRDRFRPAAYAVLSVIMIVVIANWDRRTPWQKYLDQPHTEVHPFQRYVQSGKEVYWYGDLLAPWILLRTPSFFETNQGAGMAFNRQTALVYREKDKALAALHFQTEVCKVTDLLKNSEECRPNSDVVKDACQLSPTLSAMVFPWRVDGLEGIEWTPPIPQTPRPTHYYLYECAPFRK